ncbi:MAG: hypothetical protein M1381_03900 [Deltaproteobacteria bacterium]|nr:hypothetical protein [Deltaproteobacteria bacterium]MCL5792726.1 hypothetical protein [Deltaproteobacteria bacterium]
MSNQLKRNKRRIYNFLFSIFIVISPIIAFANKDNYMRIILLTIILIIVLILMFTMNSKYETDLENELKQHKKELDILQDTKKDDNDIHIA